jgi:glutamate/tyrosine decarboxylase-like PLP-dependent enzyme
MSIDHRRLLRRTADLALEFLAGLPERPVSPPTDFAALRGTLGGAMPERGEDPLATVERLVQTADPGLVATAGPRYFGFVTGGSLPAALAADWLASAWDQPASFYVSSPAASVVEEIAADWLIELLGLRSPGRKISAGFTTGCTMANFTALAAARHAVLRRAGWDVEAKGLFGAPAIHVVVGAAAHASIFAALQMLGLGRDRVTRVGVDEQGRMRPDALGSVLASRDGPTIVCAQAGEVNTGAVDPLDAIAELSRAQGAWLHIDGAFGLWAAASPELRHLLRGVELADSWATDAHKWLNVPYDSGLVCVADAQAHHAAMTVSADYFIPGAGAQRDPFEWVPEASRRARGFAVYAALRSLGREGVRELVERCCALARRMAERLDADPRVERLNDVVLNQVLVRFVPSDGQESDPEAIDAYTRSVVACVQRGGICWLGGTTWHGLAAMRISISNWSTSEPDIDRSAAAILACASAADHAPLGSATGAGQRR